MTKTNIPTKDIHKKKPTLDYELRFKQVYALYTRLDQKYKQLMIKHNRKERENQILKNELAQLRDRIRIKGD